MKGVKRNINSLGDMAASDDQGDEEGYTVLEEAEGRRVRIRNDLLSEFGGFPVKTQARFRRIMRMWCEGHKLTKEMLNMSEGRSPKKNWLIQAFKAFKIRLYGIVTGPDFTIVEIDPAKKKDKADAGVLGRAKDRADTM